MSGLGLFLQRCQAFTFFPLIEASGLLAAVESGCLIAEMGKGARLKFLCFVCPRTFVISTANGPFSPGRTAIRVQFFAVFRRASAGRKGTFAAEGD